MVCKNCGMQNNDGAEFCIGCGTPLNVSESQETQIPQPQDVACQENFVGQVVPNKGMAIAAMVLGIVALALFCVWYISVPCAIVGVVLGGISYNKAKVAGMKSPMALAGIVCSCIAIGLAVLFILLVAIGFASMGNAFMENVI